MANSHTDKNPSQTFRILALVLIGGGLLIIGLASLFLIPRMNSTPSSAKVGENAPASVDFPAPDLQLHDLAGDPASLRDYRGKTILVNNWATWCPPCRQEMPILDAYYRDHRHQDFVIVAIDAGDPADMVADFIDRISISFPVWVDPSSSAMNSFRNNYLPSSYLINKDGQVILVWSGAVTYASLDRNITPLLKD